jgi:hypothetical protein
MLMSTTLCAVVQFLSGRKLSTQERPSAAQPADGCFSRLGIAALAFYQGGELPTQERRHRKSSLCGQHAHLAERRLLESEPNVSNRGHETTCSTWFTWKPAGGSHVRGRTTRQGTLRAFSLSDPASSLAAERPRSRTNGSSGVSLHSDGEQSHRYPMHRVSGGCHCDSILVDAELTLPPSAYRPRACDCDFCLKHGAKYVSDPQGALLIRLQDERHAVKYRQGSRLAEFVLCGNCGVLAGILYASDPGLHAALNARIGDSRASFGAEQLASPKKLSGSEKPKTLAGHLVFEGDGRDRRRIASLPNTRPPGTGAPNG